MMKVLFLILYFSLVLKVHAQTPVEIYAKGNKYGSLQAYEASKGHPAAGQSLPSESARHQLYVLSVEQGVVNALKGFYQTFLPSIPLGRINSPDEIQEAIRKAVTASNAPKLLISQPGKVRIMTLGADDDDDKT